MTLRCKSTLLNVAIVGCIALLPVRASAQWWSTRAPVDYEDCAERAEKTAATKEAKASLVSECDAKFAGRRKAGGGYTYFDFMQNRKFDIAGPNPTPEELRQIDVQYTIFLDYQRKNIIAAAFSEKQRQRQQANAEIQMTAPPPVKPMNKTPIALPRKRPIPKAADDCVTPSFSCDFPRFSAGLKDLTRTLFGSPSPPVKDKRS